MENMWNIEIDDKNLSNLMPPDEIIEMQCKFLSEATKGKIIAKMAENRYTGDDYGRFSYEFFITSIFTPNYRFSVMQINHEIPYYPLEIKMDADIAKEAFNSYWIKTCKDEEEFIAALSKVINSKKVKDVISSLYAMGKSQERRDDDLLFAVQ